MKTVEYEIEWKQEETAYYYMESKIILTMKMRMINLYLTINDTDRSHRIRKARVVGGNRKSRPLMLKFVRYRCTGVCLAIEKTENGFSVRFSRGVI